MYLRLILVGSYFNGFSVFCDCSGRLLWFRSIWRAINERTLVYPTWPPRSMSFQSLEIACKPPKNE